MRTSTVPRTLTVLCWVTLTVMIINRGLLQIQCLFWSLEFLYKQEKRKINQQTVMKSKFTLRELVLQFCIANGLGCLAHLPHELCQATDATNYTSFVGGGDTCSSVSEWYQRLYTNYLPLCQSFYISVKMVLPVERAMSRDSHMTHTQVSHDHNSLRPTRGLHPLYGVWSSRHNFLPRHPTWPRLKYALSS